MRDRLTAMGEEVDQYQKVSEPSDRLVIAATIPIENYRPAIVLPDQPTERKKHAKAKTKKRKTKSKRGMVKNAKANGKSGRVKSRRTGRRNQGRNRKGRRN
jgi:hypothetical protein